MNKKNFIFILSVFLLFLSGPNGPLTAANTSGDPLAFSSKSVDIRGLWDITTDRIETGDDYPYYASFSGDLASGLFLAFNKVDREEVLVGDYSIQGNELTVNFDVRIAYLTITDENHMSGIWKLGDGSLGGTTSGERIPWPVTNGCDIRGVWDLSAYDRDLEGIVGFNAVFSGNIDSGIAVLTPTDPKFEGIIYDYTITGAYIYMTERNEDIISTGTIINDDFLYGTYTDPETSGGIWAALRNSLPENDPPFGSFDTPADGSTLAGSVPVTGWALDDTGPDHVKIYLQQGSNLLYLGDSVFVEGARPDIAAAFPNYPNNTKAGWGYMMLTNFLPNNGNGTYIIHAIATDLRGKTTTLGIKTIYCDNAGAVKPFGAIDTPTQGGTASGSSFINWGWVLTPQPNYIPFDGSTIIVWVDGVPKGHPVYNIYRPDIATYFPGYANSQGAAGYFYLDTTAYDNGVHTIAWSAADNVGNLDGIGSRYFTIQNTSNSSSLDPSSAFSAQGLRFYEENSTGMRQSRSKCNIFGQARRPAPTRTCRGDSRWSPGLMKFDFDAALEGSRLPIDNPEPVKVVKGCNPHSNPEPAYPAANGVINIEINPLERVEIYLSEETRGASTLADSRISSLDRWEGFQVIGDDLRRLPIGSTLEKGKGIFYWQPGPGFLGDYQLAFSRKKENGETQKKFLQIRITSR